MSVKIKSALLSVFVCSDVTLLPGDNIVTEADYSKLTEHQDFSYFTKNNLIIVEGQVKGSKEASSDAPQAPVTKSIDEMTVAELRKYAKDKGIEGLSQAKREELLETIREVLG